MTDSQRHYGKFRGVVIGNIDPMQMGRLQVQVPDVLGLGISSWAMPCVPFAGQQSGAFVLPQIGAGVWIEFEQGKPDYPIWVGGFWGSAAEVPALALAGLPVSPSIVLQTGGQNTLMISDLPGPTGGILLKTKTGAMISISDVGITLSNGQGATVMLAGPVVNINQGALTVT
ncbi:Phage-related baseplate assembly protein [compost metagenome]|uniref:phage baseplate assembly protein V n=1 Tax=Achromobacter sp. Root83 TaxID=1736602 RepID=UPI00070890B3|nr:phage baseplate assembly protein V [Achromobacter sp. Root83]KRC83275.1 baseplate assembly protein [Achromobacter sp. Root83]